MLRVHFHRWVALCWSGLLGVLLGTLISLCAPTQLSAQQAESSPTEPAAKQPNDLATKQAQLADKYRRLEDLIFKMADFEATSNPRRAALLKQAYKQSKDRLTQSQLNGIVQLLSDQKYKRAIDGQEIAQKDLKDLLQLLLSEDRSDRLKSETQKIKDYIKELKRLERIQRGVRGRTEGATDPTELAKDQEKIANRTGDLAEQLEQEDAKSQQGEGNSQEQQGSSGKPQDGSQEAQEGDKEPGSKEPSDKEPGDQEPGDMKPDKKEPGDPDQQDPEQQDSDKKEPAGEQDPKAKSPPEKQEGDDSQGKPSDGKQGEPTEGEGGEQKKQENSQSQPQQGEPQQGQPGEGEEGEQPKSEQPQAQPQPEENPAKKRVREAEEKMREAQQKLEEAKRSESVEKQTEALEKLQEAIAELEEILRQLREEEMERVLALLEGRFRKMLEMELKIYEGTLGIAKTDEDKRGRASDIHSSKLAFDQRRIAGDADRALTLLLEEGSSIAFPEVVEQMRDDMEEVAARLDQVKVGEITRGLEEEIIATLEELIEALQKAQQDMEEGKPSQPGQPGAGDDPPLVDILSELKMIRSLQVRVNSRTKRYARLLDDPEDPVGQAMGEDVRIAIGKLSELELRIQRITRDIVLGKNK